MSRNNRVAALLRSEISDILLKEVRDPRIGFITITDVEIGPDLQLAKVFVSIMGDEKQKKDTIKGLTSAKKHIRYKLSPRLDLKAIPDIVFKLDNTVEKADRITRILNKIEKERSAANQ